MKKLNQHHPFSPFEIRLMRQLLRLAEKELGNTAPNPATAAAVVKHETIISTGVHKSPGLPHAEALALLSAGKRAKGASLYVNLEPCTHFGRTPPCTDAIIQAGITRVVFAARDTHDLVCQNPARQVLESAGIEVREGLLEKEAVLINAGFYKSVYAKKPYVILKAGLSLDGRIALESGESRYITSEYSRREVHRLRRSVDGIIAGAGTVLTDDPLLTVRYSLLKKADKPPFIILIDLNGELHDGLKVFQNAEIGAGICLVVQKSVLSNPNIQALKGKADLFSVTNPSMIWDELLDYLYNRGLRRLLIEGGSTVYTSALESDCVDEMRLFYAPVLLGGKESIPLFGGKGVDCLENAVRLSGLTIKRFGPDFCVRGYRNDSMDFYQNKG
ncbi:bifunctional diaminohydroxyphosphoribosylaminopyrimidine deaminase/5-amino-6-(5-phosphoribosylamino)uracil reductase RibD [Thermoproteota archaeon]